MKTTREILSENLKRIRKERKLTQTEVCRRADMIQSTYARIETMESNPSIDTVEKIAVALEMQVSELLRDVNIKDESIEKKFEQIESLSEYNQKVLGVMMDTVFEKDRLESVKEIKMNKRLKELKDK